MAHQEDEQRSLPNAAGGFVAVNNYLFTPPEHMMDSFSSQNQDQDKMDVSTEWKNTLPPIHVHVHTPPASPEANSLPNIETATGYSSSHDSPLYPDEQTDNAEAQTPLFRRERSHSPHPVSEESPKPTERSTHTQQEQSDIFPAILGIRNAEQALQYWHSRVNELRNFHAARLPEPRRTSVRDRDAVSQSQLQRISTRPAGVSKPARPAPKGANKPKTSAAASPAKPSPPRKRTPKPRTMNEFVDSAFPSAQQTAKHKRAPPSKKVEGENVSWTELPNYAPPTSSLDSNPKSLKASWNGNPVDLSKDPDREHLHPQEVAVAATLRLSCAQYMSNKRKIFQGRLQSLRDGKNFTKTAAQGSCSIDVNKASQLWEAFERVGWFKEGWFEEYL